MHLTDYIALEHALDREFNLKKSLSIPNGRVYRLLEVHSGRIKDNDYELQNIKSSMLRFFYYLYF